MNEDHINAITEKIIGAAYAVSNKLGIGFLEKVYENSMLIEMNKISIKAEQQKPLNVYYDEILIGEFFADLLIGNEIIIELKVVKHIDPSHQAQLMNYLKASKKRYGLIINFGNTKVEIKRMLNG